MQIIRSIAVFIVASAAGAMAANATMRVTFVHPERFSDASFDRGYAWGPDEPALSRLKAHLEALGAKHLRPDQTLAIEILDVDLAGRLEWPRGFAGELRVLTDIDAPRFVIRYRLSEGARQVLRAEETVTDVNFRSRTGAYFRSDRLRYEKALLDDWFRARILERRPPPR
jgi:hypothetical protein